MKKTLLFLLGIILSIEGYSQPCVPGSWGPNILAPYVTYGSGDCNGLLDRYLARSMMISKLSGHVGQPDYCDHIDMIKELDPAYLGKTAGEWGLLETDLIPGGTIHTQASTLITDINMIYSNDNIRLPIFEGCIYETVSDDVDNIAIPGPVISTFANDPDYMTAYPSTPPPAFEINKIKNTSLSPWWTNGTDPDLPTNCYVPDITRIQTRMWMYYLATVYIDMGCRSLHFGGFEADAPLFNKTHDLFQKIRAYAASIGTFVVITADSEPEFVNGWVQGGPNYHLFDFITVPLRPEPKNPTSSPYTGVHCAGEYMTELAIETYHPDLLSRTEGIAPMGCHIDNIPVLFYLNFYGIPYTGVPPSTGLGSGWNPHGINEISWFSLLNDDCQGYWLQNTACAIKNNVVKRGYLEMPGMEELTWWGYYLSQYEMADHPTVIDVVRDNIWTPDVEPDFVITKMCLQDECNVWQVNYIFDVSTPDGSSVYTFHIENEDTHTWLKAEFGKKHVIKNLPNGNYRVYLRVDNIEFDPVNDVITVSKELIVNPETKPACP